MSRHDLTDREFNAIRHFLPAQRSKKPGRPWTNHRRAINGILWILKTGSPWRDLPSEFGKWQTVYARFRRWTNDDLWRRIYRTLLTRVDTLGKIDRSLWCVDGSVVRAHRCASGMMEQSEESDAFAALGRSRGGYSTKMHILCDGGGTLLGVTLTGGQRNDSTEFDNLIDHCELSLHRYASRPDAIAGDKGYSSKAIREHIKRRSIQQVIASRSNETRDDSFDRDLYRNRNIVERLIGWLKESRRIATRYDKLRRSYVAFIYIAAIRRAIQLI